MKNRNAVVFCLGLLLGLLAGYLLTNRLRAGHGQEQATGGKTDHVVEKINFEALLGQVGEGKWTLVPIPNDSVKQTRSAVSSPATEATVSTSRAFVIRCEQPETTVDQEQAFFNKLTNYLREEISKYAVTTSGGSIGMVPLFQGKAGRYYFTTIHFHTTPEHPNPDTRGGLRGSATVWVTSDGKAASALVTMTEVARGDR